MFTRKYGKETRLFQILDTFNSLVLKIEVHCKTALRGSHNGSQVKRAKNENEGTRRAIEETELEKSSQLRIPKLPVEIRSGRPV